MTNPALSRIRGMIGRLPAIPEDLCSRFLGGRAIVYEDRQWFVNFLRQLRKIFDQFEIIINIQSDVNIRVAYQKVKITTDMLEASDDPLGVSVPRSVLTTASSSEYEFDWTMCGVRDYKVVMGPGSGVPSHAVIIDRDDMNQMIRRYKGSGGNIVDTETSCYRPYGMSGLKLQSGVWRADGDNLKFWPKSMAVDSYIYLEQKLPMVDFK